jgi:hypothetical protein
MGAGAWSWRVLALGVACSPPESKVGADKPLGGPGGSGSVSGTPADAGPGAPDAAPTLPPGEPKPVAPGTGVTLSGTLRYAGNEKGAFRIDVLALDALAKHPLPRLVATAKATGAGPWTVEVPKDSGEVHVVAFLDVGPPGPDAGDPAARTRAPVTVGTSAVGNIDLDVSDTPDLGDLAPKVGAPDGSAPPEAATKPAGTP